MIETKKISLQNKEEWHIARYIREEVFVKEQNVPLEEEYDEFDATSTHFLAFYENKAVGTCRWRYTDKGIKLERFAVLDLARGKGVGYALVEATLADIAQSEENKNKLQYLHAQITAVALYEKFGFQKEGNQFDECGIWHYKMILS